MRTIIRHVLHQLCTSAPQRSDTVGNPEPSRCFSLTMGSLNKGLNADSEGAKVGMVGSSPSRTNRSVRDSLRKAHPEHGLGARARARSSSL